MDINQLCYSRGYEERRTPTWDMVSAGATLREVARANNCHDRKQTPGIVDKPPPEIINSDDGFRRVANAELVQASGTRP
jgi:hypothetical protein